MRGKAGWFWLVALAVLLPLAAGAQELRYRVDLTGLDDADLTRKVEQASRLVQLDDEPPPSLAALNRRAEADRDRIQAVLRSEGYYAGEVTFSVDGGRSPAVVTLTVRPGPVFTLQSFLVELRAAEVGPRPEPVPLDSLDIVLGQRARAEPIVEAQTRLLHALAEQGYPLAKMEDSRIVVDHAAHEMRVRLTVEPGPQARLGPVIVTGLDRVDEAWVRRRIPWEWGEIFSVAEIEDLREALQASRLFSSIRISTAQAVEDGGLLPVTLDLAERDRRSVGVGVEWNSSQGFGATAFWEHRNLMGGAESLRAELVASQDRNALGLDFRRPDILAADQNLLASARAEELRTEAFVTRTVGGSAGVEWVVTPTWAASLSTAVERTFEEEDDNRRRSFTLVSFPLEARHDSTDDILDPSLGNRFRGQVRPFVEALGGTIGFTRIDLHDSQYVTLLRNPRLILAGWAQLGTIQGAKADTIPADKRFYVGGAGSVRAFGYQMAGPLDQVGDPEGGRSALAFGGELRARVTDSIGLVPFVEAGRAYATPWPDLDAKLLWGGGLGLRYHTPIGPVRADVALPFNRREGVDDPFQLYLSLGQAF